MAVVLVLGLGLGVGFEEVVSGGGGAVAVDGSPVEASMAPAETKREDILF